MRLLFWPFPPCANVQTASKQTNRENKKPVLPHLFRRANSLCRTLLLRRPLSRRGEPIQNPIDVASLQGEELEKYAYGCEYYAEDTTEKVETSASEAYSAYVAELAAKSQEAVGNKSLSVDEPFKSEWNDGRLPNLGFDYAVFGSFYGVRNKNQGLFEIDDEDKHNCK